MPHQGEPSHGLRSTFAEESGRHVVGQRGIEVVGDPNVLNAPDIELAAVGRLLGWHEYRYRAANAPDHDPVTTFTTFGALGALGALGELPG